MTISERAIDIEEEFSFLEDWEDRYAHIIDLGKSNPGLLEHEKTEATRVRGCASQVWMVTDTKPDNTLEIRAESDAMIVSGLIAILIRLYSGIDRAAIQTFDAKAFLDKIGVSGALSAQRSNGLASMLMRIQEAASSSVPVAVEGGDSSFS